MDLCITSASLLWNCSYHRRGIVTKSRKTCNNFFNTAGCALQIELRLSCSNLRLAKFAITQLHFVDALHVLNFVEK